VRPNLAESVGSLTLAASSARRHVGMLASTLTLPVFWIGGVIDVTMQMHSVMLIRSLPSKPVGEPPTRLMISNGYVTTRVTTTGRSRTPWRPSTHRPTGRVGDRTGAEFLALCLLNSCSLQVTRRGQAAPHSASPTGTSSASVSASGSSEPRVLPVGARGHRESRGESTTTTCPR